MISLAQKKELLSRIAATMVKRDGVNISIHDLAKNAEKKAIALATATDSLMPILRTALVINWRETAMKSRYDRFKCLYPDISTLAALKRTMDSMHPLQFCKEYLNINANTLSPEKNPKYRLLRELVNGFLDYQEQFAISSEIEAIRHWSKRVDLCHLKQDFIGRRHGVGVGVVENIRLNLGDQAIKPDRHVIGVMKQILHVDVPVSDYGKFAEELGMSPRYLDSILFEYGKAKGKSHP